MQIVPIYGYNRNSGCPELTEEENAQLKRQADADSQAFMKAIEEMQPAFDAWCADSVGKEVVKIPYVQSTIIIDLEK